MTREEAADVLNFYRNQHYKEPLGTEERELADAINEILPHYTALCEQEKRSKDYHEGDVCFYGYGEKNKSLALVEIVRVLNDERGVAEVMFLKVFVDDTGNGLFNYLLKSGKTMNASFQYLKNITPKMEG